MSERILIAVDPDALAEIKAELAALRSEIRSVRMSPIPEWVTVQEYAGRIGRTTRTVSNLVKAGKLESKRQGRTLMIRQNSKS